MKYVVISILAVMIAFCTVMCFMFDPKSVAHYCVETTCIDIVEQNKPGIAGGSNYITIYKSRKFTRLFLNFGDYAQFPLETAVLVSRYTIDNKIVISGSLPVKVQGDLSDILIFKGFTVNKEADTNELNSFDIVRKNGRAI